METLNNIEKIALLVSTGIVFLANLFVMLERAKKREKQNGNSAIQKHITINLKTTFIITLFLSSFLIKAQDTIYFKNKTIVAAKVTEVGISEIKYQRLDNLTGPNYLSSKNEIAVIKYSNGVTDSIKSIPVVASPISVNSEFNPNPEKVRLSGNKIIYEGRTISDKSLRSMTVAHPSAETKVRLEKEFKKLNEYKLKESALAVGLFLSGTVVHSYALQQTFGGNFNSGSQGATISSFIAGAALRISGHVVNIVYRNKKKSKRQDIVDIYNGL